MHIMYIITVLSVLAIQTHPTNPTLAVNNHRMLVCDDMDQVWAIYSVLSIVVGPMFPLVNSSHLYISPISPISPAQPHSNHYISWQRAASAAICWLLWSSHIGLSNKPLSPNNPIQEGLQLIFTILYLFHAHNVHNYCALSFSHPNSSYQSNLGSK